MEKEKLKKNENEYPNIKEEEENSKNENKKNKDQVKKFTLEEEIYNLQDKLSRTFA